MPDLYIITGSNGAGKSSVGSIYLPECIHANCEIITIIDKSESRHKLLVYIENAVVINAVKEMNLPEWFINGLPSIYQAIAKK